MRTTRWLSRALGLALISVGLTIGCAQLLGLKEDVPAAPCVLNSDCAPSELCIFRVCSEACKLDKDCAAGARCLDTNGAAACVESTTAECGVDAGDTACPPGTVCDSSHVCRNDCTACHADQTCTAGVCVGTDVNHDPGAPASSGSGGSGGSGAGGASATGGDVGSGGKISSGGSVSTGGKTSAGGTSAGGSPVTGAGSGGAPMITTCGDTAVGDKAPCSEDPNGTAITFPGGTPQGPCVAGSKLCQSDGNFGPCMGAVAPAATDCTSALDKNCNGKPDNTECGVCTVGATQYCYDASAATSGVGSCKPGTQVCELDMTSMKTIWGTCSGEVTPAVADTCDTGNDATCNNVANEGCACINGTSASCGDKLGALGDCAAGVTKCANGAWQACSITPKAADACNPGDDATCNGHPNEGCTCVDGQTEACGASATGCTLGSQTCAGGGWGACTGNTCADFSVGTPAGRCTATATAGEPNDNTCAFPVCPAGYYVSTCTLHIITAYGSCVFNGPDGADPTQANITVNKPLQGAGSTCAFTACSCRYDGF